MSKTKVLFIVYRGGHVGAFHKLISNDIENPLFLGTYPKSMSLSRVLDIADIDLEKHDAVVCFRDKADLDINISDNIKIVFVLPPQGSIHYDRAFPVFQQDTARYSCDKHVIIISALFTDFCLEMDTLYRFLNLRGAKRSLNKAEKSDVFKTVKEFLSR